MSESAKQVVKASANKCAVSKPDKEEETGSDKGKDRIMWKVPYLFFKTFLTTKVLTFCF